MLEGDDNPPSPVFPTTKWTLIKRIRDGNDTGAVAKQAMEELCGAYWYPLYVYARRFGLGEDDAKDAVQELFARMMEGNRLALADESRGKLRNFLLTALKNLIHNDFGRQQAAKRGGGQESVPLDLTDAEGRYVLEPESRDATPETAFERKWALELLKRTREKLRVQYEEDGKTDLFDQLAPALSEGDPWQAHPAVAKMLGMNEGAVKVALHRLRKRFAEALRAEVSATLDDDESLKAELNYLINLFNK
ncbi:MAG: sigma-70 family RNA polymerase sigma factor [Prosthecobacter sp.]|nr:sigma-70 family RNA polymerase sigma factor [Prosthecobacter sp.]